MPTSDNQIKQNQLDSRISSICENMGSVDKCQSAAETLEKCCAGLETTRRKEAKEAAWRQEQNLLKTDLERRLAEDKCRDESKLEMKRTVLENKLQVSRNHLEQVAGTVNTKGLNVEEEVKTLHLCRTDLIKEICNIRAEVNKRKAEIEKTKTKSKKYTKEETADKEVLAGLKALVRHNLEKLLEEQEVLSKILEATKRYARELPQFKAICEKQLIEAKRLNDELEFGALVKKVHAASTSCTFKVKAKGKDLKPDADEKNEPREVGCEIGNYNNDKMEEDLLAEKSMVLESFQKMLNETLEITSKFILKGSLRQEDKSTELDAKIQALRAKLAVAEEEKEVAGNNGLLSEGGSEDRSELVKETDAPNAEKDVKDESDIKFEELEARVEPESIALKEVLLAEVSAEDNREQDGNTETGEVGEEVDIVS